MFAHPMYWQELFNPGVQYGINSRGKTSKELLNIMTNLTANYPTRDLAKMFMYGAYLTARSQAESKAVADLLEEELKSYPFMRKDQLQMPYFTPVDLSKNNLDTRAAMTDAGVCHTYNGNFLHSTYRGSQRINDFGYSLDTRVGQFLPKHINGTGQISQLTLWLNAKNNFLENAMSFEALRGKLTVALNDWQTYYNVRINQLKLTAGTEVTIRIKPTKHVASSQFRTLSQEIRQCRFSDEQEVNQLILIRRFHLYTQVTQPLGE